ncbi:MAG: polysaccharide deacetylase family protein [Burkholderiales bacterium]|nr:polysaccharide deacetylase family protein [Burkholderiales bacterium]
MVNSFRSALIRSLGFALSPGGARGRLSILIYHRVLSAPDPLLAGEVDARQFSEQMELLASEFNVLPLSEAAAHLATGKLPARAACVTFDDGYADNHDIALPILRRAGVPATFFIASGHLDAGRMWNDTVIEAVRRVQGPGLDLSDVGLGVHLVATIADRRAAMHRLLASLKYRPLAERDALARHVASAVEDPLPDDLMMTRGQVRALHSAGMEIGGHTVTHPILTRLAPPAAEREIVEGKAALEDIIGGEVALFAYPNGKPAEDFAPEHVAMARKAGFRAAVTTSRGAARSSSDVFQLPRFTPWDREPSRFALRLLMNARRAGQELPCA